MGWLICAFAGWGDGSTGNAVGPPVIVMTLMVLPLFIYFAAGVTASLSTRRWIRILAVCVAHSVLLLLLIARDKMLSELVGIYAIIAILFCLCWVRLLKMDSSNGISHLTSEQHSPARSASTDSRKIPMTTLRTLAQDPDDKVRRFALEKIEQLQENR